MRKILVTGGTVFVSQYIAQHYVNSNDDVYVLNRNTKPQIKGVTLIQADRHNLGNILKDFHFDVIIDTAYSSVDVELLLDAIGSYTDYILISSSAVYPEYLKQPFTEISTLSINKYWGKYGLDKINAEHSLLKRNPNAYILRPPYLYGPMNNVYREAFVFDCAIQDRPFYLPNNGEMRLQFLHIKDLCTFIDVILKNKPVEHIFNVGNKQRVTIKQWVTLCYAAANKQVEFVNVYNDVDQRNYFSFYNYEYYLDVTKQYSLMPDTTPLKEGLSDCFKWYKLNEHAVIKKPFITYIDNNL